MLDVDARHRDLLFLLGLAPLALGCAVGATGDGPQFTSASPGTPPGDGDTDEDDTSTGSGEGGSTGGGPTGPADDDPSASASVSVSVSVGDDGSTSSSTSGESLSVSASASASVGEEDTYYIPPPTGYACEGYAYVIAGCYYGGDPDAVQYYTQYCELAIAQLGMMFGPACAAAFEETRACISELSCQELMMYGSGTCVAEHNAYLAACM